MASTTPEPIKKIGTIRYAWHTYWVWQEGEYYAITMNDVRPYHFAYKNLSAMIERKFGRALEVNPIPG